MISHRQETRWGRTGIMKYFNVDELGILSYGPKFHIHRRFSRFCFHQHVMDFLWSHIIFQSGGFVSLRKRWISQNWRNQTHFLWMKFGRWIFFSRHAGVGSCKIADNRCWSLSSFFKHPESHFKFHSDFISFWLALFTLPHCRWLFVECSFNFYTLIGDGKPPPHRMNANPIKSCHCECEDKREKPNKSSKKSFHLPANFHLINNNEVNAFAVAKAYQQKIEMSIYEFQQSLQKKTHRENCDNSWKKAKKFLFITTRNVSA